VATGYDALVAHYQFRKHARKWETAERLVGASAWRSMLELGTTNRCQVPDLLMYADNHSDWFFCEVKGPNDRLRPRQREFFDSIARITHKPIYVLTLREISFGDSLSPA
jgi:hypothetical protein